MCGSSKGSDCVLDFQHLVEELSERLYSLYGNSGDHMLKTRFEIFGFGGPDFERQVRDFCLEVTADGPRNGCREFGG